jgi:hypothetical protein
VEVVKGKGVEQDVVLAPPPSLPDEPLLRSEVRVRDDGALRLAGRPARIELKRGLIVARLGADPSAVPGEERGGRHDTSFAGEKGHAVGERWRHDHGADVGVAAKKRRLGSRVKGRKYDNAPPRAQHAEERGDELGSGNDKEGDSVALERSAAFEEARRDPIGSVDDFPPGGLSTGLIHGRSFVVGAREPSSEERR